MKTKFTTAVLCDGFAYGLDEGILACLDIKTGKQIWKGGRYQHGQILLAGDLLIVQAEEGEVVLVKPDPKKLIELGRIPALSPQDLEQPGSGRPHAACAKRSRGRVLRIAAALEQLTTFGQLSNIRSLPGWMVLQKLLHDFGANPLIQLGAQQVEVCLSGDDFNHRVAFQAGQRLFEQLRRALEIERVELSLNDVQLAGQFRAQFRPIPFEHEADIIVFPGPGQRRVDGAAPSGDSRVVLAYRRGLVD